VRLAAACFCVLVLGFAVLAQVNLWHQVAAGRPPGLHEVLVRYHGDPERTLLDDVFDLDRDPQDARNMWQYLGTDAATQLERRERILAWVDAGAPRATWPSLAPIFTSPAHCGGCHTPRGIKRDLPLTTYEEVVVVTEPGGKFPLGSLLISAHNHLFAFAALALLLSVLLCTTRLGAPWRPVLILGASAGAALDVSGWFLTRSWGSPWHVQVILGGALFGIATTLMALVVLFDALFPRRLARTGEAVAPPEPDASP
jgi:hypothetical protein